MVFALSITPKLILHQVVATHEDLVSTTDKKTEKVSPAGFSCDCNHLVVESPFADDVIFLKIEQTAGYNPFQGSRYITFLRTTFHSTDLRGPPVV